MFDPLPIAALMRASNCTALDFPLEAALRSALAVCETVCIAVDKSSTDDTVQIVEQIRAEFNAGRVHMELYPFDITDPDWQVQAYNRALALAWVGGQDWTLLLDADECLSPDFAAAVAPRMVRGVQLIRTPVLHLFGHPDYINTRPDWYTHHTRLGRTGTLFMKNFNDPLTPERRPVCDFIARLPGGAEVFAHSYRGREILDCPAPILHYGWLRHEAAQIEKQTLMNAWYSQPGRAAFSFAEAMPGLAPHLKRHTQNHPPEIDGWLQEHADVFAERLRLIQAG